MERRQDERGIQVYQENLPKTLFLRLIEEHICTRPAAVPDNGVVDAWD